MRLDADGYIGNDAYQATSAPGIYAIGDVSGRLALTPVAIAAGRRLSDRLFGGQAERHLDYDNVPTVLFGHPPIGTVGLSEVEARKRHGDDVQVYMSSFVPLYYSMIDSQAHDRHEARDCRGGAERIVGAHVVGPGADEMLQGFAVAVRMGATQARLRRHRRDPPDQRRRARHDALRERCRASAASTGAVSGAHAAPYRNDSAACSTSMPRPCSARAQPCSRAQRTNGVTSLPYVMS